MKWNKNNIISIVLVTGIVLAAQIGFATAAQANGYPFNEFAEDMCFEAPESCEYIGDTEFFCGEEYLCSAPGPQAAGGNDPTFRQCIDKCFADSIRAKRACDTDYQADLRWCDRNSSGYWRDACYYAAGQTWNLCFAVAGAELTGCLSGCGVGVPLKGAWKKITD